VSGRADRRALHEASREAADFPPVLPDAVVGGCAADDRADGPLEPNDAAAADTWLGVVVRDHHGHPVTDELVEVVLQSGDLLRGRTDGDGRIRFEGLRPDAGDAMCTELLEDDAGEPSG